MQPAAASAGTQTACGRSPRLTEADATAVHGLYSRIRRQAAMQCNHPKTLRSPRTDAGADICRRPGGLLPRCTGLGIQCHLVRTRDSSQAGTPSCSPDAAAVFSASVERPRVPCAVHIQIHANAACQGCAVDTLSPHADGFCVCFGRPNICNGRKLVPCAGYKDDDCPFMV